MASAAALCTPHTMSVTSSYALTESWGAWKMGATPVAALPRMNERVAGHGLARDETQRHQQTWCAGAHVRCVRMRNAWLAARLGRRGAVPHTLLLYTALNVRLNGGFVDAVEKVAPALVLAVMLMLVPFARSLKS